MSFPCQEGNPARGSCGERKPCIWAAPLWSGVSLSLSWREAGREVFGSNTTDSHLRYYWPLVNFLKCSSFAFFWLGFWTTSRDLNNFLKIIFPSFAVGLVVQRGPRYPAAIDSFLRTQNQWDCGQWKTRKLKFRCPYNNSFDKYWLSITYENGSELKMDWVDRNQSRKALILQTHHYPYTSWNSYYMWGGRIEAKKLKTYFRNWRVSQKEN